MRFVFLEPYTGIKSQGVAVLTLDRKLHNRDLAAQTLDPRQQKSPADAFASILRHGADQVNMADPYSPSFAFLRMNTGKTESRDLIPVKGEKESFVTEMGQVGDRLDLVQGTLY